MAYSKASESVYLSSKWYALFEVLLVFFLLIMVSRLLSTLNTDHLNIVQFLCVLISSIILLVVFTRGKEFSKYKHTPRNFKIEIKALIQYILPLFVLVLSSIWSAIILVLLAVTKRDFSQYGITIRNFKSDLKIAIICIVPLLAIISAFFLGPDTENLGGLLLISVVEVVGLLVVALLLKRTSYTGDKVALSPYIVVIGALIISFLTILNFLYPLRGSDPFYIKTLINAFVFGFVLQAIPQELFFRGYIQSRLNEAFGRPYNYFGINMGAGLIIASLIFGFMHVLNTFNPFASQYNLDISWGIWTFFTGLLWGIIREKTGNIVAPTILHGVWDFIYAIGSH